MYQMDIFFLFLFVLSIVHVLNILTNVIKNILSDDPKSVVYSTWGKISNYFFISYLLTYIIKFF